MRWYQNMDVTKNGFKNPIYFDYKGKLLDGSHRIILSKAMNKKHIFTRII